MRWMRTTLAAIVIGVLLIGYLLWARIDWASYGPAEVPLDVRPIDTSLLTIRSLHFDRFDALVETPEVTWSQRIDVKLEADCVPDRFRIYYPGQGLGVAAKEQRGRLQPAIKLDIVRRSSLGDGSKAVSLGLSGAKVDSENRMYWATSMWAPRVPGRYRVRVLLSTIYRDVEDRRHDDESLVGIFEITVIPGESAEDDE